MYIEAEETLEIEGVEDENNPAAVLDTLVEPEDVFEVVSVVDDVIG